MAKSKKAPVSEPIALDTAETVIEYPATAVNEGAEDFGSLEITGVSSWSISQDNQTVLVVFTVKGDTGDVKFALTYPADKARWLCGFFADIGRAAASRNIPEGQLLQHMVGRYDIGHSDQTLPDGQALVGVTFDKGSPGEYTWVMGNIAALRFCHEMVERGIKPRLNQKEREMWAQVSAVLKREIIPPGGSKILRPQ